MPEPNVFRGSERDWSKQYSAIGEFVVAFEGSTMWIRYGLIAILQHGGLRQGSLGDVIFNHRIYSAEPLFSVYASLSAEALPNNEAVRSAFSSLRERFANLCKLRNDLLHAIYFIGPDVNYVTDRAQPPDFHAERRTPDKDGARVVDVARSLEEMGKHIAEAWAVKQECIQLFGIVSKGLYESQNKPSGA